MREEEERGEEGRGGEEDAKIEVRNDPWEEYVRKCFRKEGVMQF